MRQFADRLRGDGIDSSIDQYAPAPPRGWPMWMQEQILRADFVLIVCTETYLRRVECREEPGKGLGVLWEATLIYNLLYPQGSHVQRFVPVLFANGHLSSIPLPLRGLTHYRVDSEEGYENLYRHITNQPLYDVPAIGKLRSLPAKETLSFPASLAARPSKKPTTLEERHRQQLIKQVRLDWIVGVLDQSLYKVARVELGLTDRSDFVEQPIHMVFHNSGSASTHFAPVRPNQPSV